MAVDATKRKLTMPLSFVPYLEKHRIYELFFEIGEELVINKPVDPILFLKNLFDRLNNNRDQLRVILIGPEHVDLDVLGAGIAEQLGLEVKLAKYLPHEEGNEESLADAMRNSVLNSTSSKKGWICYDYPKNKLEANAMLKKGVIPTHTLLIVPSKDEVKCDDFWNKNLPKWSPINIEITLNNYRRNLVDLEQTLKRSLTRVEVKGRNTEDMIKLCINILKVSRREKTSALRVVLIGPRGSYRRTIAKMLEDRFHFVHVDMEALIAEGKLKDNELGAEIRRLIKYNVAIYGYIILQLLKNKLSEEECLTKGWVLTGFPRNREDLEVFDKFDMTPNRVIFLDVPLIKCFKRLVNRRVNMFTCEIDYLPNIKAKGKKYLNKFSVHPRDKAEVIEEEHKEYSAAIKGLLEYCGENCSVLDATGSVENIFEKVVHAIFRPAPAVPPRGLVNNSVEEDAVNILKPCDFPGLNVATFEPIFFSRDVLNLYSL